MQPPPNGHLFVILALYLSYFEYPRIVILGLCLQSILTPLCWQYSRFVWMDRLLVVFNMINLSRAHNQIVGIQYKRQVILLCFPLFFFCLHRNSNCDEVTVWYYMWHVAIVVINMLIVTTTPTSTPWPSKVV